MKYSGIDLHSNNSVVVVCDEAKSSYRCLPIGEAYAGTSALEAGCYRQLTRWLIVRLGTEARGPQRSTRRRISRSAQGSRCRCHGTGRL